MERSADTLLENELHRKQRLEIARTDRLLGARMQNRRQRLGRSGDEIVPAPWGCGFHPGCTWSAHSRDAPSFAPDYQTIRAD